MTEPEVRVPGLTKAESAALEALFGQDLPGAEPAKIRKKVGDALTAKGFAKPTYFVVGYGPLSVKVSTYQITPAGHMAYCAACPDVPEDL
ncbi:MAG: hypothetical protein F8N36_14465 [Desulfovibrio sp.]|uniref:hypothetical protein n=1 Tax=Desulfovibrio sp. TaxID=885 RepID=UPI00135E3BCC|nr:hypothetical protein [Desulfovibrio sp.]MTJ94042.1 hypothetical protein [Desulfovibrio sp.]